MNYAVEVFIYGFQDKKKNTDGYINAWEGRRWNKAEKEMQDTVEFWLNGKQEWYFVNALSYANLGIIRKSGCCPCFVHHRCDDAVSSHIEQQIRDYSFSKDLEELANEWKRTVNVGIMLFPDTSKDLNEVVDTKKAITKTKETESKYYVEYQEKDGEVEYLGSNLLTANEIEKKYGKDVLNEYLLSEHSVIQQSNEELVFSFCGKNCKIVEKGKTYPLKDWDKYIEYVDSAKEILEELVSESKKTKHYL